MTPQPAFANICAPSHWWDDMSPVEFCEHCINGSKLIPALLLALVVGCSSEQTDTQGETAPTAAPSGPPALPRNEAAPGATVFFITPKNGDTVSSPLPVKFGVSGIAIQPAGVRADNSGHHHLLIDSELGNPDLPLPSDPQHLHFGNGQTETVLELTPGDHTLQLVLGDTNHVPHIEPVMSQPITITVAAD